MKIIDVTLPTTQPASVAAFYSATLQLPVDGDIVQVGSTALRLTSGPEVPGSQHLAFNIPADRFDAAVAWLTSRCEPMSRDGQDRFHFDPPFDADSIYFLDPDGTILELISRRASPASTATGSFTAKEIQAVSEVAVAVPSVPEAATTLSRLGLSPVGGGSVADDARFAAIGDHDGMIILTDPARPWLPTFDRLPNPTPTTVVAELDGAVVLANGTRVGGRGSNRIIDP